MKLGHVSAVCRTTENAERFYQDILGLKKVKSYSIPSELSKGLFNISLPCDVVLYRNNDAVTP